MADEETTHERRLKILDGPIIAVAPDNPFCISDVIQNDCRGLACYNLSGYG